MYIHENIPVKVRKDLNDENFERLWVVLRPIRLPRAISRIAVACVYIPPSISHDDLNSFYEYFFIVAISLNLKARILVLSLLVILIPLVTVLIQEL